MSFNTYVIIILSHNDGCTHMYTYCMRMCRLWFTVAGFDALMPSRSSECLRLPGNSVCGLAT